MDILPEVRRMNYVGTKKKSIPSTSKDAKARQRKRQTRKRNVLVPKMPLTERSCEQQSNKWTLHHFVDDARNKNTVS